MVDEVVVKDVFRDDDEDEEAAAFTDSAAHAARVPPPLPSSLQPTSGQSRWPSKPLSPLLPPSILEVARWDARRLGARRTLTSAQTASTMSPPRPPHAHRTLTPLVRLSGPRLCLWQERRLGCSVSLPWCLRGGSNVSGGVSSGAGPACLWPTLRCHHLRRTLLPLALVARVGANAESVRDAPFSSTALPCAAMSTKVRGMPFLAICGCRCFSASARGAVSRTPTAMDGGWSCYAERRRSHDWLARGLRLVRFHQNWSGAASTVWSVTILPPLAAIAAGASGVGTRDTTCVSAGVGRAWPVDNLDARLMVAMQWRLLMGVCRTPSQTSTAVAEAKAQSVQ
jgi:hypothetical protein